MTTEVILLIIGIILALPGGLFVAFLTSRARAKWAAIFGGIIGAIVVGLTILFYVNTTNMGIDGLSYFYGVFFACSVGVVLGALIVNFLVGLASRTSDEALLKR